eukprot:gene17814-biopygen38831
MRASAAPAPFWPFGIWAVPPLAHAAVSQQMAVHHSPAHRCCNRTLRVAMAKVNTPCWLYQANRTPAFTGVYPKVLDMIADETGFTFEAVQVTWKQLMEESIIMLANKSIDIIPCVGET